MVQRREAAAESDVAELEAVAARWNLDTTSIDLSQLDVGQVERVLLAVLLILAWRKLGQLIYAKCCKCCAVHDRQRCCCPRTGNA